MIKLTKEQRIYLKKIIRLQDLGEKTQNHWNNGIRTTIKEVLFTNEYDDIQKMLLNEMNDRYSYHLKVETYMKTMFGTQNNK